MIQLATVQKCLIRLNAHYPDSGHTVKTLKVVAEDWLEDLRSRSIDDDRFVLLVKEARRESVFFPKIADILNLNGTVPSTHIRIENKKNPGDMSGYEIVMAVSRGELPEKVLIEYGLNKKKHPERLKVVK